MVLQDFASEVRLVDVHIYFGRADILVSEHGLDGSQVGASFQELRGKAVAEGVRADVLADAGLGGIFLYIYEERDAAQPFAPSQRDEHEVFFAAYAVACRRCDQGAGAADFREDFCG